MANPTKIAYSGIAISGKIGAGKTTVARLLSQQFNIPVFSLAYLLKEEVASAISHVTGLSRARILTVEKETWRPILQAWGQCMKQRYGDDYWVRQLFEAAPRPFICDDVRFPVELDRFQAENFLTVRLGVSPDNQRARVPGIQDKAHTDASETALDHQGDWGMYIHTDDRAAAFVAELIAAKALAGGPPEIRNGAPWRH